MITTGTCSACFRPLGGVVYVEVRDGGIAHWNRRCRAIVGDVAEDVALAFVRDDRPVRVGANSQVA
ncbi:hypothetical protein [Tsukamurella pulmonis]|uniref:hypothetical protein n=1 Tax=Tsukamurella pulmonis TaxID=47312 RepID=UPI000E097E16|nr:hypothetical protein [Tsukamurella pulmonis]RDH13402.1 hypothetical protein DVB88_02605 [Tsukamurella pulmonis]